MFDVFEAFLNTDNIQVFANAATSYIMCLMKFVKGLGKWNPHDTHSHCQPFHCRLLEKALILGYEHMASSAFYTRVCLKLIFLLYL